MGRKGGMSTGRIQCGRRRLCEYVRAPYPLNPVAIRKVSALSERLESGL